MSLSPLIHPSNTAPRKTASKPPYTSLSARVLPCVVFIMGCGLSAMATMALRDEVTVHAKSVFDQMTQEVAGEVWQRFSRHERSIVSLAHSLHIKRNTNPSSEIAGEDLQVWTESHDASSSLQGSREFGFIAQGRWGGERSGQEPATWTGLAQPESLHIYAAVAGARARAGALDRPLTTQVEAASQIDRSLILVDDGESRKDPAMVRAAQTGKAALSGAVVLESAEKKSLGFVYYYPVYRDPQPKSASAEQRQHALHGLSYVALSASDLLGDIKAPAPGLHIAITTPSAGRNQAPEVLHKTESKDDLGPHGNAADRLLSDWTPKFNKKTHITVGGTVISVDVASDHRFAVLFNAWMPILVGIMGVLLSAILALLGHSFMRSKRREAQQALVVAKQIHRQAVLTDVATNANAVLLTDCAGLVMWANAGFERLTGLSVTSVIGQEVASFLKHLDSDPTLLPGESTMAECMRSRKSLRAEMRHQVAENLHHHVFVEMHPVCGDGGQADGFVFIESDITRRKEAEDALRKSDDLLRGAIDAINEAFVLYDANDKLVFCNEKFRSIYTLCGDHIREGADFERVLVESARCGQFLEAIGREKEWIEERLVAHRQGHDYTGISRNEDGRIFRVIDQRMADGHTVGFRIEITDLVRATESAQEASKAKSQFLANMSHEIRTPMNAILGMLALLGRTELTSRQSEYVGKTERAARSLLGLLNDILDFSKVEAGKMTLDPHPFEVEDMLQNLSVILSATASGKKIEVLYDLDPSLPKRVIGDDMRIQQVLINLGGNAVKFTEQGEVVIALEAKTPVTPESTHVTVEFAVRDTGIGIAQESQDKIFNGFTQAESSTTRRFGGTGLGVAICQRLIRLMGGELKLSSKVGEGSCFSFELKLPIDREEILESQASQGQKTLDSSAVNGIDIGRRIRALIIDDSATARAKLKKTCEAAGWEVQLASSGRQGLDLVAHLKADGLVQPFDVILVDWQMPDMDGWATSRELRRPESGAGNARILMVTAQTRDMLASRSEDEQALLDGFVVKPVTLQMLLDACALEGHGAKAVLPKRAPSRRLAGLRLLVAEDNPTNQQVAKELLEAEGALVEIADNGEMAVRALSTTQVFSAVLMDVQMPVMDGLAATRHIREDARHAKLPIIAMTANAMADDREMCLAAGMNEHVGKPFDIDELIGVILHNCGLDDSAATVREVQSPLHPSILECASRAGVDVETALHRMGGNIATYRRMMLNFAGNMQVLSEQFKRSLAAGDWVSLTRHMHTLKGLAGTLGLTEIARLSADLEDRAKSSNSDNLVTDVQAIGEAIAAARPAVEQLCKTIEFHEHDDAKTMPGVAADVEGLLNGLEHLSKLLLNIDMEALTVMEALRGLVWAGHSTALQSIDDDVMELKFREAHEKCVYLTELLARDVSTAPVQL